MARYHGIDPAPSTRLAVEQFENQIMIRHDNRILVASVYLDMEPTRWAVAIAYNPSRNPGLHGHENVLEVRYTYSLSKRMTMKMMRSNPMEETVLPAGPFQDPDAFAVYAIAYERDLIMRR